MPLADPRTLVLALGPFLGRSLPGLPRLFEKVAAEAAAVGPEPAWLIDWLLKVHGLDAGSYCYQPLDGIPQVWLEGLERLRDQPAPPPVVEQLKLGRERDRVLEDFGRTLAHHDKYAFAGERAAWSEIQEHYESFSAALASGRPQPPPEIDDETVERALDHGSVIPRSSRARHFEREVEKLRQLAEQAHLAVAHGLEPPTTPSETASGETGRLLEAIWNVALGTHGEAEALEALTGLADRLGTDERRLLARVTATLHADGRWTHPSLEEFWRRAAAIEEAIETFDRQGANTDFLRLCFDEFDLDEAEQAVDELRAEQRERAASQKTLTSIQRCRDLLARLQDRQDFESTFARLTETDAEPALEAVRHLESALAAALHTEQTAWLEDRLDVLRGLGNDEYVEPTRSELDELRQTGRPLPQADLDRVDQRVDAARNQAARALREGADAARATLDRLGSQIPNDDRAALEERLRAVEVEVAAEGYEEARVLLDELGADLAREQAMRWMPSDGEAVLVDHIVDFVCRRASFDRNDVLRLHVALKAKRFVVLAGMTGTGKSTLAREYAAAIGATRESGRFRRIAVKPNWIDGSEVLGYVNPRTNRFEPGWLASVARDCARAHDQPFFVLLDEMNLAPVEHYLSDALTAMEEGGEEGERPTLNLYNPDLQLDNGSEWKPEIGFPRNLFLLGTVNIDESTRPLTDRVLDRASLIQLRTGIDDRHHRAGGQETTRLPLQLSMSALDSIRTDTPDPEKHDSLIDIGDALGMMGIGLGMRNHIEIERLLANARDLMDPADAFDAALLQRVLPRLRGYRRDLLQGLEQLRTTFLEQDARRSARVLSHWIEDLDEHGYVDGTSALVGIVAHR